MPDATLHPEIEAMRAAYEAISSRPSSEHDRIMWWLKERLNSDHRKEAEAQAALMVDMREPSQKMIADAVEHLCLAGLPPSSRSFAEDAIKTMLSAEREACAKIADRGMETTHVGDYGGGYVPAAASIAEAIRNREG